MLYWFLLVHVEFANPFIQPERGSWLVLDVLVISLDLVLMIVEIVNASENNDGGNTGLRQLGSETLVLTAINLAVVPRVQKGSRKY